ncbi:MAG: N-acetylmuramoyl-L-alanine amidase [Pseudomonadota bacterium]
MKKFAAIMVSVIAGLSFAGSVFAAELIGVRFGPSPEKTRIVFDINGAPKYAMTGDEQGAGRLFIDFADFSVGPVGNQPIAGKGHIGSYVFARRADGGVRAIVTFKKTAKIAEQFVIEPSPGVAKHRLVIDVKTSDMPSFIASIPSRYPDLGAVIEQATTGAGAAQPVAPSRSMTREVQAPLQPPEKRVIVVDAGHGGRDPGAQGQSGTLEKHVNMKAALELKEMLEKTDRYTVILTRESDRDPKMAASQREELARREAMARAVGADLFISLHADALPQKAVRGASVYTLSQEGTKRSARLAKEAGNYTVYELDASEYQDEAFVSDILLDIAQNATNNASSRFAEILLENLEGVTPLLNRSHRTADLRVLLAPDVPAVLFEMAYISNAKDEANLNSPAWRRRTMSAVAAAIDAYFEQYDERQFAQNGAAATN